MEWEATHGEFDDVIDDLRAKVGVHNPMFIMIDPFGVKGVYHETIRRLGKFRGDRGSDLLHVRVDYQMALVA